MTEPGSKPPLDFPELESAGPGAPADEFAGIPSSRRRHPIIAVAAALLAVFLIYQIHDDLFFALSHANPTDVGDARPLAKAPLSKIPLNQVVRVSGTPDRESGVILDTAGSWQFTQFFRLLGTSSRLFVNRVPNPIPVEQAEKDVFVGRLLRFRDLSFADAIRKHFANVVTATHFFAAAALRDQVARAGGAPIQAADLLGEKVALQPTDELFVDVARPADLQVDLPRSKFHDLAAARAAVEAHGAIVLDEAVKPSDEATLSLVVTFASERRDQGMSAIADLDPRVRYRPTRTTYTVKVADLGPSKDGLEIKTAGEGKDVPLDRILAIRSLSKVQIPDDALILREGDKPADHYKTVIVAAFLLGFALLNLLALRSRA